MRVLDLFSGIGGFSLGLERAGMQTVAFCEIEEFPRAVLRKHWPDVPIFEDVRKLKGSNVGPVDVICGGYPCQPFSTAGKRRGAEDDRHLWPEFNRLVAELRPAWVIGENVAGHISMGLDDVLSDLEGQGYACRSFVIPACAVDAPHRRDRVWTVGHAIRGSEFRERSGTGRMAGGMLVSTRREQKTNIADRSSENVAHAENVQRDGGGKHHQSAARQIPEPGKCSSSKNVADAERIRQPGSGQQAKPGNQAPHREGKAGNALNERGRCEWLPEPDVGRVANGVPRRVDRLKALGNAVVPQIAEMIGRAIMEAEAAE